MNKNKMISLLLCIMSTSVFAEVDISGIEEQERAQIISELTYRLETKQNCSQTLNWDDSGSGADLDGYFFFPNTKKSEYIIGGHASGKRTSKYHCVTTVSEAANNPKETPVLLVKPADWKRIWKDSGSGATKDGSFWQAIPPDDNYKCIGSVSQLTHNQKPQLSNYRCVHTTLTNKINTSAIVWSDKGTGADEPVTIFSLPSTGVYAAVATRSNNIETYNLNENATSVADPKKVEEILAKRLAPLKADIEAQEKAKAQALQEQEEAAKKEEAKKIEEQKIAAKRAEQKKIAAAEEKKKQAAAEQKALAEQVDTTQEEIQAKQEAEKLKAEQLARIEKAKEEKAAAEKAKLARQEKNEKENVSLEPQENVVAEAPAKIENEESNNKDTGSSESKGLNDILMFFLKIFGMMIGGVIIFMIAFKVLFGKKDK